MHNFDDDAAIAAARFDIAYKLDRRPFGERTHGIQRGSTQTHLYKFAMWDLVEYTRIIYMDSDLV